MIASFCCDDHGISLILKRLSEESLTPPLPIYICSIVEIDTALERLEQGAKNFLVVLAIYDST
jgi:hypothetical protein